MLLCYWDKKDDLRKKEIISGAEQDNDYKPHIIKDPHLPGSLVSLKLFRSVVLFKELRTRGIYKVGSNAIMGKTFSDELGKNTLATTFTIISTDLVNGLYYVYHHESSSYGWLNMTDNLEKV